MTGDPLNAWVWAVLAVLAAGSWHRPKGRAFWRRNYTATFPRGTLCAAWVWAAAMAAWCAVTGRWELVPQRVIEAAAMGYLWWRLGGGDSTRRGIERGTGWVRRQGARLVVVTPAPA